MAAFKYHKWWTLDKKVFVLSRKLEVPTELKASITGLPLHPRPVLYLPHIFEGTHTSAIEFEWWTCDEAVILEVD